MDNLAYDLDNCYARELHSGDTVDMFARPSANHYRVSHNICRILEDHFDGCKDLDKCTVFGDGVDLFLTEEINFVPDGMVVCDPSKIKLDGVHGAPDLVVEVLSPGTYKYDLGYKKEAYGRFGVKEYWIADTRRKSIEIYLSKDGRMELWDIFILYPDIELAKLSEEELRRVPTEFNVPSFPGLRVSLERVFSQMIE